MLFNPCWNVFPFKKHMGYYQFWVSCLQLINDDIGGIKKEKQAVRMKIKDLEEELKAIDDEISSLQEELDVINKKRNKAYETLIELRKSRDEVVWFLHLIFNFILLLLQF